MNLVWNVYYHDINKPQIRPLNIFDHGGFAKDVQKLMKTKGLGKDEFAEEVRRDLMYYFWCKSEYEIVMRQWCGTECELKVDIYSQVMLNFDHFIDYLWRGAHER